MTQVAVPNQLLKGEQMVECGRSYLRVVLLNPKGDAMGGVCGSVSCT